jgi:hypothetical protein
MFTIQDEGTGNYLSWRSLTNKDDINRLYVTYSGKLGTDFFPTYQSTIPTYNQLMGTAIRYGMMLNLHIIEINMDCLPLGEQKVVII